MEQEINEHIDSELDNEMQGVMQSVTHPLFELMELFKVKNLLNYHDIRSVIRWCSKNHVFIIKQGNKKYVNKWEFILSFYKPFIIHLKQKHKNWKELFLHYLNGELTQLLTTSENNNPTQTNKQHYKPRAKQEVSFLNTIKQL